MRPSPPPLTEASRVKLLPKLALSLGLTVFLLLGIEAAARVRQWAKYGPAGQIYEFTTFYREGLGFTTSLFSSSFFTLTGFHGVHVSGGIIMLIATMGMVAKNQIAGDKAETIEMVGLYWHFVDVVWIIILIIIVEVVIEIVDTCDRPRDVTKQQLIQADIRSCPRLPRPNRFIEKVPRHNARRLRKVRVLVEIQQHSAAVFGHHDVFECRARRGAVLGMTASICTA